MVGKGHMIRFPLPPFSFETGHCCFLTLDAYEGILPFTLSMPGRMMIDCWPWRFAQVILEALLFPEAHFWGHGEESASLCLVLRLRNMLSCEHAFDTDVGLILIPHIDFKMLWVAFLELLSKLLFSRIARQKHFLTYWLQVPRIGSALGVGKRQKKVALPFGDVCALI